MTASRVNRFPAERFPLLGWWLAEHTLGASLGRASACIANMVGVPLPTRLADLQNPRALRDLFAAPESDVVERKRTADAATLAKVVSAFANTNGGWLLLGLDDDGSPVGWRPKGRAHPRDWLRDVLDERLDPLPAFEAELFEHDGLGIGVVRVPRSSEAPHFINATGEVFERRNGQTRRATAARVREMQLRGGAHIGAAAARLDHREAALDLAVALGAPRVSTAMHARALASILRISVAEPSPGLRQWVHSPQALTRSHAFVWSTARGLNDRDWCTPPEPPPAQTTAGGHIAKAEWDGRIVSQASVGWDRVGLGGVRLAGERPDDSGVFYLLSNQVRDEWLTVSLAYIFECLNDAEVVGSAAMRWDLHGVRGADVTTVNNQRVVTAQGVVPAHYNNMVAIDLEFNIGTSGATDVAGELWQELERLAGAAHY